MKYLANVKKKKIFNNLWRFLYIKISKQSDSLINGADSSFLKIIFSRKTETFNSLIHWIQTECSTFIATFTFNIIASISPTASISLFFFFCTPRYHVVEWTILRVVGCLDRVTPRRVSTSAQSGWCRGDLGKPQ